MKKSLFLVPALALLACSGTSAATLFTISNSNSRSDFTGTLGASFTVGASDLLVTSLGVQDFGDNGLTEDHAVGIWETSTVALTSVTVPSVGTSAATVVGHFQYASIPAYTLLAGHTYFIGAQMTSGGDAWSDGNLVNVSGVSSGVSGYDSKFIGGSPLAKPTSDSAGIGNLRWGPANMQFTVVPEPAAALLGSLGLLGLLRRRR